MTYIHNTYENTRESTDEVMKWNLAHLTRNGINDVHQAIERYNSLVNVDKVARGDGEVFVDCAWYSWEVRKEPVGNGRYRLDAWSIEENGWRTLAGFAPRNKRLPKGSIY